MEREKKRTKEEEEELDRKIAQIREKNQKIVERTREVEEDKAKYAVDEQKGVSKPIVESPTTCPKKGEWSREWDQGKTSADTWRENVPSIELSSRLAGRGGSRGKSGGAGRGNSHNNRTRNQPDIPRGSRLEGRLTIPTEGKEKVDNSGSRNGGRGGNRPRPTNNDSREVIKRGKDLKVKITNDKNSSQANQQQTSKQQKPQKRDNNQKVDRKDKPAAEQFNKERRPQNDDRHVIKLIIKKAIDKIEYLERCEKRRLKQEAENSIEIFETSKEEYKSEEEDSELPSEDAQLQIAKEIGNVPEDSVEVCKESQAEEEEKEIKKVESEGQDANQNVIKLVTEKVLTLEVSS